MRRAVRWCQWRYRLRGSLRKLLIELLNRSQAVGKRPCCGQLLRPLAIRIMRSFVAFLSCLILLGCGASSAPEADSAVRAPSSGSDSSKVAQIVGQYLCTVAAKASIESLHLEDSGPPVAVAQNQLATRFKIRISEALSDGKNRLRLDEVPYNGADRDPSEWHTSNQVLHSSYLGNGDSFHATGEDSEAFFTLRPTVHKSVDGELAFHHSGFEWAGGEDQLLSVRWGRCRRA